MFDSASVMGRFSHLMIRFCQQHQLDVPPSCYTYQDQERIPLPMFELMLAQIKQQYDPVGLGILLGGSAQLDDIGVIGYLSLSCETFWEVVLRLVRYHRIAYDVNDMQVNFSNDSIEISWGSDRTLPSRLVEESLLSMFLTVIRQLIGTPDLNALSVSLLYGKPSDSSRYEQFFGCPVQFSSEQTRLQLPISVLSAPVVCTNPMLSLRSEQQAEAMLSALPEDDRLIAELRRVLVECLHNGESTLEQVALRMHLSSHTLETRLAEHEQNFAQILSVTRRKLAEQYLRDASLPLADVAFLLGYEVAEEFEQDYQKWTGHKPTHMAG